MKDTIQQNKIKKQLEFVLFVFFNFSLNTARKGFKSIFIQINTDLLTVSRLPKTVMFTVSTAPVRGIFAPPSEPVITYLSEYVKKQHEPCDPLWRALLRWWSGGQRFYSVDTLEKNKQMGCYHNYIYYHHTFAPQNRASCPKWRIIPKDDTEHMQVYTAGY